MIQYNGYIVCFHQKWVSLYQLKIIKVEEWFQEAQNSSMVIIRIFQHLNVIWIQSANMNEVTKYFLLHTNLRFPFKWNVSLPCQRPNYFYWAISAGLLALDWQTPTFKFILYSRNQSVASLLTYHYPSQILLTFDLKILCCFLLDNK